MDLKEDKPTAESIQEEYKLLMFNNKDLVLKCTSFFDFKNLKGLILIRKYV
jgi:hypothetical protein